MRAARIGPLLLGLGVVVGTAAGIGLLVGFEPAQLPRALLNIAAYKLTFLAAAGLLTAGALVLRYGRKDTSETRSSAGTTFAPETKALAEGFPAVDVRADAAHEPTRTRPARGAEKGRG